MTWIDDWPVIGDSVSSPNEYGKMCWRAAKPVQSSHTTLPHGSDDFSFSTLKKLWAWNHQPDSSHWSLSVRPGFLRLYADATADSTDSFFKAANTLHQRYMSSDTVIKHQKRRGPEWTNIEEEKELSRHQVDGRVVLIDCVTLWATNYFFDLDSDVDLSLQALKQEFDAFTAQDATFIFVTNEIGSGAVSDNPIQRRFTDLQGWMNQYIASQAHQVYLMVSGIPVLIKQ